VIQVVYLTFGHYVVEPTVHSVKICIQLVLSWQMCIKYAQTMAATKHIQ